jgi:hypothetical protein
MNRKETIIFKYLSPGAGVFFCFLRVFFCTCPHCCRKHCGCQFPCCFQRGGDKEDGVGVGVGKAEEADGVASNKVSTRPEPPSKKTAVGEIANKQQGVVPGADPTPSGSLKWPFLLHGLLDEI